ASWPECGHLGLATRGTVPWNGQCLVLSPRWRTRPRTSKTRGQGKSDLPGLPGPGDVPRTRTHGPRTVRYLGRLVRIRTREPDQTATTSIECEQRLNHYLLVGIPGYLPTDGRGGADRHRPFHPDPNGPELTNPRSSPPRACRRRNSPWSTRPWQWMRRWSPRSESPSPDR